MPARSKPRSRERAPVSATAAGWRTRSGLLRAHRRCSCAGMRRMLASGTTATCRLAGRPRPARPRRAPTRSARNAESHHPVEAQARDSISLRPARASFVPAVRPHPRSRRRQPFNASIRPSRVEFRRLAAWSRGDQVAALWAMELPGGRDGTDPATRGRRANECLAIIRQLLDGSAVRFHGAVLRVARGLHAASGCRAVSVRGTITMAGLACHT